jgi:uncharacterized protein (DUF1501 family)
LCFSIKNSIAMTQPIADVQREALAAIAAASTTANLTELDTLYLGRKAGRLTGLMRNLGTLPPDEKPAFGAALNAAKTVIEAAIANYETAFRMQTEVPVVADIQNEPESIRRMYGADSSDEHQRYYASQAIRARRLVEAGVRFVEITCPSFDGNNSPWDQHAQLKANHEKNARITEQSVAALISDLHQRGLLDETIVLWAGEMGRTPHTPAINAGAGRDHHVSGYSLFMAGGGFKGGTAYGETDEFGANAVLNPVSIHDIHATILHQMGLDHTRLTFRHGGRDVRLTDVHGHVVTEVLA